MAAIRNSKSSRSLFDHWAWEPPMIKAFLYFFIFVPSLLCLIFLPFIGAHAFFILLIVCIGPFHSITYGFVGKKINDLRASVPADASAVIPARIVKGKIEAAGLVVLMKESIIFLPVMGDRLEIRRSDISSVREVKWFNGSMMVGKTGFWFTVPDGKRRACAVPNSFSNIFRTWLSQNST